MTDTKRASLEELRAMRDRGETAPPAAPTLARANPLAGGEALPEDFWDTATPRMPQTKQAVSLRVDPDILDYFRSAGDGHLTRMHAVLRAYVDAQTKRRTS